MTIDGIRRGVSRHRRHRRLTGHARGFLDDMMEASERIVSFAVSTSPASSPTARIVWDVATNEMPRLLTRLRALAASLP